MRSFSLVLVGVCALAGPLFADTGESLETILAGADTARFDGSIEPTDLAPPDVEIVPHSDSQISFGQRTLVAAHIDGPARPEPGKRFAFSTVYQFSGSGPEVSVNWTRLRVLAEVADTPGVTVTNLGMNLGSHVRPGGKWQLTFDIRAAVQPSAEANWVVVRWQSPDRIVNFAERTEAAAYLEALTCRSGCLSKKARIFERGTAWAVFPLIPGSRLPVEILATVKPPAWVSPTFTYSPVTSHFIQVFGFGLHEAGRFGTIQPQDVGAQPPLTRPQNDLLTYIAAIQRALEPGGWLLPEGPVEQGAALSLARLLLLKRLSVDPATPRSRRTFLEDSLVGIARRIFDRFAPPLSDAILLSSALLGRLEAVETGISRALGAAAQLSDEELSARLAEARRALRQPAPNRIETREALIGGLADAEKTLTSIVTAQRETLSLRCEALARLQYRGHGLVRPFLSRTEVFDACDSQLSP